MVYVAAGFGCLNMLCGCGVVRLCSRDRASGTKGHGICFKAGR